MKAVVIISGGFDSTTLLHYVVKELKREVYALSFNYKQKANYELECAKWQCKQLNVPHKIIDMSWYGDLIKGASALTDENIDVPTLQEVIGEAQPITHVNFRNLLFLTIAAGYAEAIGATEVYYGAQKVDEFSGYWDTTKAFVDAVNKVFALNRQNTIEVKAPFVSWRKSDILKKGLELGVDYSKTWSCYNEPEWDSEGRPVACGVCSSCNERRRAFRELGVEDPIKYK